MRTKKNRMPDFASTLAGFGPRPPDVWPQRQRRKATWGADVAFREDCLCTWQSATHFPRTPSPCDNEGSADIHRSLFINIYIQYTHIIIAPSGTGPFASWLSQRIVDFRSFWKRLGPLRGAAVTTWRILTLERPMSHLSLQMLWCKFWRFGALTCCNHCTFFGFDILAFNFAKSDLLIWWKWPSEVPCMSCVCF